MTLDLTAGLGTMFSDLAEAATYTPSGGSAVGCLVIVDRPIEEIDLRRRNLVADRRMLHVRLAEVGDGVKRGDEFAIGGETLKVNSAELDVSRTVWEIKAS